VRICIVNSVALNGGDAAILYALQEILRLAFGGDAQIVVFDSQAGVARKYYPQFDFRPMARAGKKRGWRWLAGLALVERGMVRLGRAVAPAALREHWQTYDEADLIVSTGGTYLVEHYPLAWRFLHLLTAAASRRPLVLFTQSLGPFRSERNRALLRKLLPRVDLVLLRDERSRGHLADIGAAPRASARVSDGAFALASEERLRRAGDRTLPLAPRIAVSVRAWKHFSSGDAAAAMGRYRAAVAEAVAYAVREKGAQVTFLSTCQGIPEYRTDDSALAQQICDCLPRDVRDRVAVDRAFRAPDALIDELATFDLAIATRMHAAILSLVAGTPVLPIAYEFKTRELFEDLQWGDWVLDMEQLEGAALAERLERLLVALPGLRRELFRGVERHRQSALAAARLILEASRRAGLRKPGVS
jgi:colanic acid/amylovoran biosynthesis protein